MRINICLNFMMKGKDSVPTGRPAMSHVWGYADKIPMESYSKQYF